MTNKFFSMTVEQMRASMGTDEDFAEMLTEVSRRIVKRQNNGKPVPRRLINLEADLSKLLKDAA